MRMLHKFVATTMAIAITSGVAVVPASPRGSSPGHENGPTPYFVQSLPPEVRASLQKYKAVCGETLTATSGFSRFIEVSGLRLIALNFQDLRCDNKSALCDDGRCLHQVYASRGAKYYLVMSGRAAEVTLMDTNNIPTIEIKDDGRLRSLRWNGRSFVGR